jgi:hypothetical protein
MTEPSSDLGHVPALQASDVDWSTVDPAAWASMQMAIAIGPDADGPLVRLAEEQRDAAERNGGAIAYADVLRAFARDVDQEEKEVASEADADDAATDDDAMGDEGTDDKPPDANSAAAVELASPCDVDEPDLEGMGTRYGTAEASWCSWGSADDWKLQRLAARRRAKQQPSHHRGSGSEEDPAETDGDDELWEYKCYWVDFDQPTWERRGFLRELGYGRELAEFDGKRAPQGKTSMRKARPAMPPRRLRHLMPSLSAAERREMLARHRQAAHAYTTFINGFSRCLHESHPDHLQVLDWMRTSMIVGRSGPAVALHRMQPCPAPQKANAKSTNPDSGTPTTGQVHRDAQAVEWFTLQLLLRLAFGQAADAAVATGYTQLSISHIEACDPATLPLLLKNVQGRRARLLFHGTRAEFIPAIAAQGLLVPNPSVNGVRVVNGSAYGVAIYTAETIQTPLSFTYGGNELFVCVGTDHPTICRSVSSDTWFLYSSEAHVVPLFRIKFKYLPVGPKTLEVKGGYLEAFHPPTFA